MAPIRRHGRAAAPHAVIVMLIIVLGAVAPTRAFASEPPAFGPDAWRAIDAPIAPPTTRDLVIAYRTVERALGAAPFDDETAERANRVLDDVAIAFFQRDLARAFRLLREEHDMLLAADVDPRAFALRVRGPVTLVAADDDTITVPVTLEMAWLIGTYPWPLQIAFDAPDGRTWQWGPTHDRRGPEPTGFRASVTLPRVDGTWHVRLVSDDVELWRDAFSVLPQTPRAMRAEIDAEIDALDIPDALDVARLACRRRAALLTDADALANAGGALIDPATLLLELRGDLAALRGGRSPFAAADATIDRWVALPADRVEVPGRLVVPPRRAGDDVPPPLVIALHGAGGNEHLFVEGYGAGEIARLATERNFVLFSARTYAMMGSATVLPALLDALEAVCAFDRDRVVVIGHSLGAITGQALGALHPAELAGVAAIAGGPLPGGELPPTLVWVADRDRIVPPYPTLQSATRRMEDGAPVEVRVAADQGHALVMAVVLDDAITWLLERAAARPGRTEGG